MIRCASFDIGKKNFAFYIEEFNKDELIKLGKKIKNIPVKARYLPDGTPIEKMKEILELIYKNGKTILHKNLDLTANCNPKEKLDPETFHNMTKVLDEHILYFDECSAFVIEQQMSFKNKHNLMALKLGQHCYSYFEFKYGRGKQIIEFPAFHKTQILGAEKVKTVTKKGTEKWKGMDKPSRKKWAIVKATEILEQRGEEDILKNIKTVKKKDDL